nr:MAG TPA: hypothetical protein [Caudoviricetes sp.]
MYTPSSLASMPVIAPLSFMALKSLLSSVTVNKTIRS